MRARPTQGGFEDEAGLHIVNFICVVKADGETNGARERGTSARVLYCSCWLEPSLLFYVTLLVTPSTVDRAVRGVVTVDVRNPTFVPRKLPRLNGVLARGGEGTRELGRALASSV